VRLSLCSWDRGSLGGEVAEDVVDDGNQDCLPKFCLWTVVSAKDALIKPGCKRAGKEVKEVRRRKRGSFRLEGDLGEHRVYRKHHRSSSMTARW
jgi:hypothetical protein